MTEKMTSFLTRTKYNAKYLAAAGATGTLVAGSMLPAFAVAKSSLDDSVLDGGDTGTVLTNIINIVLSLFRYIGIILMIWAVGQLALAFKNEDADSKSRAIMLLVASAVLVMLKTIVGSLGIFK